MAKENESKGLIDNLKNLKDSPVYITSGRNFMTLDKRHQKFQRDFYESYGANVKFLDRDWAHLFPVKKPVSEFSYPKDDCMKQDMMNADTFFCNNGVDLAGDILKYLYSNLDPDWNHMLRDASWADLGVLRKYEQHEFVEGNPEEDGFADYGYIYYPH